MQTYNVIPLEIWVKFNILESVLIRPFLSASFRSSTIVSDHEIHILTIYDISPFGSE
jgi:hypothetical protein